MLQLWVVQLCRAWLIVDPVMKFETACQGFLEVLFLCAKLLVAFNSLQLDSLSGQFCMSILALSGQGTGQNSGAVENRLSRARHLGLSNQTPGVAGAGERRCTGDTLSPGSRMGLLQSVFHRRAPPVCD
jgi:hypothetical protein